MSSKLKSIGERGNWSLGGRVQDNMTAEDAAIYAKLPLIGRLMVHRDRGDARVMKTCTQAVTHLVDGDPEIRAIFNQERAQFGMVQS